MKPEVRTRTQYCFLFPIQTRWADNDIYGHVNNVTYYSYFDIHRSPIIGLVVNSACDFLQELTYPEVIEVGVAISKIGNSSLTYDLAIFKQGQNKASAQGHFIHVFVERETKKSTPIPHEMRDALQDYLMK
ncbi:MULTISPECIES: thioesterase family protein [unclassified Acinetobacter]|uniref:acyl-CoA thioesterase n=1 Tax=unclassified Acinetobacter TaxID=196816 RepID=UPI0025775A4D|nr:MULTISPECIES: thioesterase family protein [unclassified Acinetobacter]MDM1765369.1 acyl-CoA thioesterase [Acinetobacter sp. 226-1]MDM1768874.1 acyl-CoA thioesterase [Acinetobacter sp. 226-4]